MKSSIPIHGFIAVMFLTACQPNSRATTPTLTANSTQIATPLLTPTPAFTETPTVDPNMPPDAMGKDQLTGEYIKTGNANGKSVTYIWNPIQVGDDTANGIKGHWFVSRMENGPIDLTGYGENCRDFWGKLDIYMSVYAVEGLRDLDNLGLLYHPAGPSDYITKNFTCTAPPDTILMDLFMQQHNLHPEGDGGSSLNPKWNKKFMAAYYPGGTPTPEQKARVADDWQNMIKSLNADGGIHVGDQLWQPHDGYEVYWITEEMAAADPTMHISLQAYTVKNFYWKVMVRDGTLIAIMAPAGWLRTQFGLPKEDSRERIFRWITLYPIQMVIDGNDVVKDSPGVLAFQDYGVMMGPIPGYPKGGINTSWIAFTH